MIEIFDTSPKPESGELTITQAMRSWIETNVPHHTNDFLIGRDAPTGYGDPVSQDVEFGGLICDIYHTDTQRVGGHRAFIQVKN